MRRRRFFCLVSYALAFSWYALRPKNLLATEDPPSGSVNPQPGGRVADLEQTLKSGLKARRPVEFAFIEQVVERVKAKQIPISLVQTTFSWARRHQPYPYPYFERGMRERAQKLGVTL